MIAFCASPYRDSAFFAVPVGHRSVLLSTFRRIHTDSRCGRVLEQQLRHAGQWQRRAVLGSALCARLDPVWNAGAAVRRRNARVRDGEPAGELHRREQLWPGERSAPATINDIGRHRAHVQSYYQWRRLLLGQDSRGTGWHGRVQLECRGADVGDRAITATFSG